MARAKKTMFFLINGDPEYPSDASSFDSLAALKNYARNEKWDGPVYTATLLGYGKTTIPDTPPSYFTITEKP